MIAAFYVHQSDALPVLPFNNEAPSPHVVWCRHSDTLIVPVPEGTTHLIIMPNGTRTDHAQLLYLAGYIAGSRIPAVLYAAESGYSVPEGLFSQIHVLHSVTALCDWLYSMHVQYLRDTELRVAREQLAEKGFACTSQGFVEAVRQGDSDAAALFLQAGFSADSCDERGISVLSHAVRAQLPLLAEMLLASGADLNKLASDRLYSPLMDAVQKGDLAMVNLLLSKGADTSLRSRDGQTALIISVGQGSKEIAALLLRYGADPAVKDNLGMDASGYARLFHNDSMSELFTNGSL